MAQAKKKRKKEKKKMQHLSVYMSVGGNVKEDLFTVILSYFLLFIALAPPFDDHRVISNRKLSYCISEFMISDES